ncbi:MAG: hypothetical protein B7W99_02495 [Rhodospirillales bacterium 20-58-10]|nr:MAG: hypothetical protein B7W99_02495 [Rhodospirillales bacterium 20-58-10]
MLRDYSQGQQIPTEEELTQCYGVSRVTVRRAIQTLVEQNVLLRRQGKGTFLAAPAPRFIYELDRFGPFLDAIASAGEAVSVTVVDYHWTSEDVPAVFGDAQDMLTYARLYESAGKAHALIRIMLPPGLGEKVTRANTADMGVYQILKDRLGVIPNRASFNISTELPNGKLAATLRISPSSPLLVLDRVSYDAHDHVLERTLHYLLPDAYRLKVGVHAKRRS